MKPMTAVYYNAAETLFNAAKDLSNECNQWKERAETAEDEVTKIQQDFNDISHQVLTAGGVSNSGKWTGPRDGISHLVFQRDSAIQRAEAAEAENKRLREAIALVSARAIEYEDYYSPNSYERSQFRDIRHMIETLLGNMEAKQ